MSWCRDWWSYNVSFSKAALFVAVAISGHGFVDYSIFSVWIEYITDNWDTPNLPKAASIVNFQTGVSIFISIFFLYLSGHCFNRFVVLCFTALSSVVGIVILWVASPNLTNGEFSAALALGTLGQAGLPTLLAFLIDQFEAGSEGDPEKATARAMVWRNLAWYSGIVVAVATRITTFRWKQIFMFSSIYIIAASTVLWCGYWTPFYKHNVPTRRRCGSTLRDLKSLKLLITLWFMLLVYGLVEATANTLFVAQSDGLDDTIRISSKSNYTVPVNSFFVLKSFVKFTSSKISDFLINAVSSNKGDPKRRAATFFMTGLGFLSASACCFTAARVEHRRLKMLEHYRTTDDDPDDRYFPMSIMWLVPQFLILGLANGLLEQGLPPKSLWYLVEPFQLSALGMGCFVSSLFMSTFRFWFGKTINKSRFDRYYFMLAILCLGILSIYIFLSLVMFHRIKELKEDDGTETATEEPQIPDGNSLES